ncbi:hypothetical protein DFJ58DRAFT_720323 [Suillus subalutaceus]|uniref:uncharacterized protein n=1 Tax=Suillus subalutaceus TaxID=48586 RepID=UPI001B85D430|nr:uncharacterized protein DFJ58DRAFT_720323 [Suillus subalutaceus]KAG1815335.1 hypothetical protein DFJ58DRAFT_720323 [Suillus subalutaceus]
MSSNGKDYTYTGHGTNDQITLFRRAITTCSRDYGSSGSGYHYSNTYYYSNPNGSTYYNSGTGYSQYTTPSGDTHKFNGSSK